VSLSIRQLELSMVAEYCRMAAWEDNDPSIPNKAMYFNFDTISTP
jgi:hypothetical protein|tara:strand:- start:2056 stop:2190 length:135 start_codon:yes stop_codon:yes gene_type:complete